MKRIAERFQHIKIIGLKKRASEDFYHRILTMTWGRFFTIYCLVFLGINLFFGLLYRIDPNGIAGAQRSLVMDFIFSVHTFSTIGYGMFYPATGYAHSIVVIESMTAIMVNAVLTGIIFAKFAHPTARIRFTEKILVTKYNGKKTLMFRLANLRGNQIAEASVKVTLLVPEVTLEGHTMRVQKDLTLVRDHSSFFVLTWSVMHVIDEHSPLFNYDLEELKKQTVEVGVSVFGYDETFSQSVHAGCIYSADDFVFNKMFEDVIVTTDGKASAVDFKKFNEIKDA